MYEATLRRLLELSPRGASSDQLLWRLRVGGLHLSATDILDSLKALSDRGEIVHANGRWRLIALSCPPRADHGRGYGQRKPDAPEPPADQILRAISGRCRPRPDDPAAALQPGDDAPVGYDWAALLGYYASTQRRDPRGSVEEFADRHGQSWQLFEAAGAWWEGEVVFPAESVPATLREALSRRLMSTAAIGWPVSIFETASGATLIPGLLVAAEWTLGADLLSLRMDQAEAVLNPAWTREIRRKARWTEDGLREKLFPEGAPSDFGSVADRMRHAFASLARSALRPAEPDRLLDTAMRGLANIPALFLPEDAAFTRGTARDLETIRGWTPEYRRGTALSALIDPREPPTAGPDVPLLAVEKALTPSQVGAAEAALSGPLTLIQGPPGTGKSQVILSLLISAALAGRTVLFASRNHQALDEVERRLRDIVPASPLLVRARDADGGRDTGFGDALDEAGTGEQRSAASKQPILLRRDNYRKAAEGRQSHRKAAAERARLNVELAAIVDEIAQIRERLPNQAAAARPTLLPRLLRLMRIFGARRNADADGRLRSLLREAEAKRSALDRLGPAPDPAEIDRLQSEEEQAALALARDMPEIAAALTLPDEALRDALHAMSRELKFSKGRKPPPAEVYGPALLSIRPLWAISTLSAPARIPLVPALFDYVVFDEASQCDIASALPLLARARRAVIVGDPMQLGFVPPLGVDAEHALMDAAGLPKSGRARVAQSINSLFAFARSRPPARLVLLRDQFRSAPAIVDYLNGDFYDGRLDARRDDHEFKVPSGYKPGLAWDDVAGRAAVDENGNINDAEADRIVALIRDMLASGFAGTVGVVSPFTAQVALINRKVEAEIGEADKRRIGLKVATVDKWQGGEADVVLFSLVLTPSAAQGARLFLQRERRRLNVAVSRARALCIVVGDLAHARTCGIGHIAFLAERASMPWSPPRPRRFDSLWERRLFAALESRGHKPQPQYPVGRRYLDMALDPDGAKLDIEVDGVAFHTDADGNRKVGDRLRDREMEARGWRVLRFWVHELDRDMEGCLDAIERALGERSARR